MTDMKTKVFNALDTALENGYVEMLLWEPEQIVADLQSFNPDFEDVDESELTRHVVEWLNVK